MAFLLPRDIENRPVAVIGAGTLGRRIALMFATRGGLVRIFDKSHQAGEAARTYVEEHVAEVAAGIDGGEPGRVAVTDDMAEALLDAWLVVEAVPERLDLKKEIFGELDRKALPDTILASNSSSYASSEFIDQVKHPERVLNMHFYMPPRQNAIDLMSDGRTDPGIFDLLTRELPLFGVFPFIAHKESTGFIFNRIWAAIKREALEVVAEGVSTPEDVDEMWKINMGIPAGPFRMMDQVGLDVVLDIEQHYAQERPHLPAGPRDVLKRYVDAGHLGVKSGRGFYTYDTEK
ncbi:MULTISPECIES: 3-hydroxyacyl-CoA dehydrogenase family protein [Streptomyces]|uniref:3-hydroxyacyl-CoA dehydrogenase family protein n=1 Tax=Streptomyces TaxID=1883 RepID=UPI001B38B4E9|nr:MULTISPECIES: 3-hydroxyacyl-CoA dehydrogenase NAD-binding domain-containing protein [unclassified Streptomyces]MBQ1111327.1 3-hydroxyacyl-CoA dehydrogenase family protein [Streptomyces sp. C3-3]MDX3484529.1 3-hydroxyacyl-CoA dehydrogenase NAD-binding domain-containing protein [Streptomyces sp. ID05-18]